MSRPLDTQALLEAFEDIGKAARRAGARLEFAVYGGSALMLASNFRFSSEDVDIVVLEQPWPDWLGKAVADLAAREGWRADWLNDGVLFHLSPLATKQTDHVLFGTFPRDGGVPGLSVYVASARYMLALKLKAIRVTEPLRGPQEASDILNLLRFLQIDTPEDAIAILATYFPASAASPEKQLFLLRHIQSIGGGVDEPRYIG